MWTKVNLQNNAELVSKQCINLQSAHYHYYLRRRVLHIPGQQQKSRSGAKYPTDRGGGAVNRSPQVEEEVGHWGKQEAGQ